MLIQIHPDYPQGRKVSQVAEFLRDDGVVVFPTDSVYALGCNIGSKKGFERLCQLRQVDPSKAFFSIIVSDLSQASEYHAQLNNAQFRYLRNNLPGPFTFIMESGRSLPSYLKAGRKTIGIRIPDHKVTQAIVSELGFPLITTSLRSGDEILEYFNQPTEIHEELGKQVDCIVDAGPGTYHPTTIVDLTTDQPQVLREGRGDFKE